MADSENYHWRITAAGWSYRSNDRGWIIYRDPQTRRWHTRTEAIAVIEAETDSPAATQRRPTVEVEHVAT